MNKSFFIPNRPTKLGLLRLSDEFCKQLPKATNIHGSAKIINMGDNFPIFIDTSECTIAGLDLFLKEIRNNKEIRSIQIDIIEIDPLYIIVSGSNEPPQFKRDEKIGISYRPSKSIYLGSELEYQWPYLFNINETVSLETNDLNTHVFICGVTGAGKTVLGKIIIEEAALSGIPCIAIDLKGDISSLVIAFSGKDDINDIQPFINIRENEVIEKVLAEICHKQVNNLKDFGITKSEVEEYKDKVQINIFTPRSNSGFRLAFSAFLKPPANLEELKEEDPDAYESAIDFTSDNFVRRLKLSSNLLIKAKGYVYEIIRYLWDNQISIEGFSGIKNILDEIREPLFNINTIGGMPINEVINEKDRNTISIAINELLIGAGKLWFKGSPFDLSVLTNKKEFNGMTPVNIINLKHLDFHDQLFVVGQIAFMINFWMREMGESGDPQLLFYIDEIGGGGGKEAFFPSVAKPASKPALNILLRQGRSFGVSCVFATQSPNDIDFKALANCRTWLVGQLRSDRERKNIKQGISNSDFESDQKLDQISDLKTGQFLITAPSFPHDKKWKFFQERWLMHLHRGLSDKDLKIITARYEEKAIYSFNLAKEKMDNNEYQDAEVLLQNVINKYRFSKNRPKAYLMLGQLYYYLNKFNNAIDTIVNFFSNSLDVDDYADAYFLLGKCYLKNQQVEKAINKFELALEFNTEESMIEILQNYIAYTNSIIVWKDLDFIDKMKIWVFEKFINKSGKLIFDVDSDNFVIEPYIPKINTEDLAIFRKIDYSILKQEIEKNETEDAEVIIKRQKTTEYMNNAILKITDHLLNNELLRASELSAKVISRLITTNTKANDDFINLLNELNKLLESRDKEQIRKLLNIEARQFEFETAHLFSLLGYKTIVTKTTRDDGVDIFASKDDEHCIIQCKRYTKVISRNIVDELIGTLSRYKNISKAILVTTSSFSDEAKHIAKSKNIELWDSFKLRETWDKFSN